MNFVFVNAILYYSNYLCRQLGHKRYQPIWEMANKLRDIMGKRDNEYQLSGQMELDNAFYTTEIHS